MENVNRILHDLDQGNISLRSAQELIGAMLVNFLLRLNDKGLINNHDFDYEMEAKKYLNEQ